MDVDCEFPTSALLPKKETGASAFISKYPEYDGRGTVIAIFDSGVDPGAAGFQVTSDGKPKVIGRYDCSGAGDVDTSTVVQSKDGELQGLTGRKLKIPSSWKNPSGDFHIGIKNGFEIFPGKVPEKIIKERKEKQWDPDHKTYLANATRDLNAVIKEQESNKSSTIPREEKLKKEELEAKVDVLNTLEKKHNDLGFVYDCIVFHDGEIWRACLDTSECGDLESCHLLGEYSKTRDFVSVTPKHKMHYSINVHEEGNVLEIVSVCSTHGTHVAAIAAANFPDAPERNGVAPGAQIISLCIGDSRVDTMETGSAIMRAMIHVMSNNLNGNNSKIDVINMSYGERAHFANAGRVGEVMSEVVDKYGVMWLCSAGNMGPALCTVGTPPNIAQPTIMGVGAYVSPEMQVAEYSLRQKVPGMPFTWSSRGPTVDGEKGVSVSGPGAAITSVSCYTMRGTQLMNGTSMAAPHVAGCAALLISGLKAQGVPYSPFSIRRAMENTAQFIESMDPFAQGHGLVQVEKAFDNLVNFQETPDRDVRFHIMCGPGNNKGIHVRSGTLTAPKDYAVSIDPVFADSDNVAPEKKINFQMSLALVCSAPWVQCPSLLEMMNVQRTISVRIDPTGLPYGVHNTCLRAYDIKRPEKGPVFRVEITVVQPQPINLLSPELSFAEHFDPSTIKRHFLMVPDECTWAIVRLKSPELDQFGRFIIHCIQLRPKRNTNTLEFHKMVTISNQSETTLSFQVKGGVILEFVVAKYWASLGNMKVDYKIEFHGCKPDSSAITMLHADGIHSVELSSGLRNEEVAPSIQLKNCVQVLRPTEAKINALSSRDVIPVGRQIYQLLLTYSFHLNKSLDVTPNSALLSNFLYESEFESQLWMLFDCNKQFLASGDAYPEKYNIKLEKGDYTIKHSIRHEKKDLLEKLTDLPFLLSQKLATAISVDAYGSESQALVGGKKLTSASLPVGKHRLPIYIAPLPSDKIQKIGATGQYLSGTVTYAKDELGKKVDSYSFKYVLADPGKKSSAKNGNEKTKQEEYEEALRDLQVSWLQKLDDRQKADELYEELGGRLPEHLAVHTAMLSQLEGEGREWPGSSKPLPPSTLLRMRDIASKVISSVDATALLAHLGTKSDQRPDASKIKQQMDRQKTALVEALSRYGSVQCRLFQSESSDAVPKPTLEDIDKTYVEMLRFSDTIDKVTGHFTVWHACVFKQYGRMLKALFKLQEEKPTKETEEAIIWAMNQLGWSHSARLLAITQPIRYPPADY